jgi:MazG family protein
MLAAVMPNSSLPPPSAAALQRLLDIMVRLRDPHGGCPWDLEQDFRTIAPYTIEEAYEVADAIERGDMGDLKEELGDLLLQVVFHARMAEEEDLFDFTAVAEAISDKMVRRHPHVFAEAKVDTAAAQTRSWEAHKAAERATKTEGQGAPASVLDNVTVALPALTRAMALQRRAARIGFDWPAIEPVLAKIEEEIAELRHEIAAGGGHERFEDELGDLLFAAANLARHLDVDAEAALRRAGMKFERRFRQIETALAARGRRMGDASLDEMEAAWQAVKAAEPGNS